eukprot:366362-Chlamydomonas_euryale.AAC.9
MHALASLPYAITWAAVNQAKWPSSARLVALEGVLQIPVRSIVHQHAVADARHQLAAVCERVGYAGNIHAHQSKPARTCFRRSCRDSRQVHRTWLERDVIAHVGDAIPLRLRTGRPGAVRSTTCEEHTTSHNSSIATSNGDVRNSDRVCLTLQTRLHAGMWYLSGVGNAFRFPIFGGRGP